MVRDPRSALLMLAFLDSTVGCGRLGAAPLRPLDCH
jgi:hypothetical protein